MLKSLYRDMHVYLTSSRKMSSRRERQPIMYVTLHFIDKYITISNEFFKLSVVGRKESLKQNIRM